MKFVPFYCDVSDEVRTILLCGSRLSSYHFIVRFQMKFVPFYFEVSNEVCTILLSEVNLRMIL